MICISDEKNSVKKHTKKTRFGISTPYLYMWMEMDMKSNIDKNTKVNNDRKVVHISERDIKYHQFRSSNDIIYSLQLSECKELVWSKYRNKYGVWYAQSVITTSSKGVFVFPLLKMKPKKWKQMIKGFQAITRS